jgi:hypothetical protein
MKQEPEEAQSVLDFVMPSPCKPHLLCHPLWGLNKPHNVHHDYLHCEPELHEEYNLQDPLGPSFAKTHQVVIVLETQTYENIFKRNSAFMD